VNAQLSYLSGLMVGRGRMFNSGRLVIEFSHTNMLIKGISRCPKCKSLATQIKKKYSCKNTECGNKNFEAIKNEYNQIKETKISIDKAIVPFLKGGLDFKYETVTNQSITLLILDFNIDSLSWKDIISILGEDFHYHSGAIPEIIYTIKKKFQIEFINGVLDTAGFCNAGGWVPRNGKHSNIRQRLYFQFVKNWKIVVEMDNFLRSNFSIPIQTIDWGHPNIRDGNLSEYLEGKSSAYAREHQLKVYPEYMKRFNFRITSKNKIFKELIDHNTYSKFNKKEDWFPPTKIIKFKPVHPEESNIRMPKEVRKHFDSFWQINLALGCSYLTELSLKANDPDVFAITGQLDNSENIRSVIKENDSKRRKIDSTVKNQKKVNRDGDKLGKSRRTEDLELATYPILKEFFDKLYFSNDNKGEFFITNYLTLSSFMKDIPEEFVKIFDQCADYKIRPDLVGFSISNKNLVFVESKVDVLDMEMVGQLLGYCLVAQPKDAYLVSTKALSSGLVTAISAKPNILSYGPGRKIIIGQIIDSEVKFYDNF
jgi:hypothetical protein